MKKKKNVDNLEHPVEKLVQTITYKRVELEVVERPDVLWVGCVDFADNNENESDIPATLERFKGLVNNGAVIKDKINPDWGAALSINYCYDDKPCGVMFANEAYSAEQDERFDLFTQPGSLWLRALNDKKHAKALRGKKKIHPYELFGPLKRAAEANGYMQNPDVRVEVEYHCHAEYDKRRPRNYAYIPICAISEKND